MLRVFQPGLPLKAERRSKAQASGLRAIAALSAVEIIQRKATSCACGGFCPRCRTQSDSEAALPVSRADDPLEREADRVAEQVMTMAGPPASPAGRSADALQRQAMVEADEEEEEELQAKAATGGLVAANADAAAVAVADDGQPLSPSLRAYFEPRFGRGFGDVRVHTDSAAAQASAAIDARAFTLGQDIAFAAGEFAPDTREGRRLIAHELGHVAQQQAGAPPAIRRQQEGTTEFRERAVAAPTRTGSVWSGHVERTEVVPASGTAPEQEVHRATVGLAFDESSCTVRVAKRVAFQQAGTSGTPGICDDSPPLSEAVDPLLGGEFTRLRTDYIRTVNEGLNGWYTARLEGDACAAPCMDGNIAIRAELVEDRSSPEFTINVVNRDGRGDARTICARGGLDRTFAVHEGGHQLLGVGDEYAEPDPAVCRRVPQWCRAERVRRRDWSQMGEHHDYGRFALFHERHFQFVPEFLRAAFPDCRARLVEMRRPIQPDIRLGFTVGGALLGGRPAYLASAGIGLGIPLDRLREVEAVIGLQGTAILAQRPDWRQAFLLGMRASIERRATPSAGGWTAGAFLEGGYGRFSRTDPATYAQQETGAPYGQAGVRFGWTFAPNPIFQPFLGIEATGGAALSTTGTIGAADPATDESWRRWFGLGASLEASF